MQVKEKKPSETKNPYLKIFSEMKENLPSLKGEGYKRRLQRLTVLEKWVLNHRNEIQQAVYRDFKKPAEEADLSEVFPVIMEIRKAKKNLKYWTKPRKLSSGPLFLGSSAHIQFEPKGICLIIAPWNYPFNLTIGPLVSAIAAGNVVILKPSEFTPNTSRLVQEMVTEVFESQVVKVIEGDHMVSGELLKLPFDHIFFTGSPRVGKIVMEAAAKNLASVTLELGGKSPVIIDKSANIKDAAEKIAWGKWLNAGQTCVAPDYMFVHHSVRESFVKELVSAAKKFYGDPNGYACIVNNHHHQRLHDWLEDATSKGAKIEWQAEITGEDRYFPPVIVSIDKSENTYLLSDEIFGPVLPIMTFDDVDEVVGYINQKPKPLALYVFGNDAVIQKVSLETSSGTFVGNDCVIQFGHPQLPFGGVNNSGIGKSHGHYGFIAFSNEKSVLIQRTGLTMAKTLYPPFDKAKKLVLDTMIKYM